MSESTVEALSCQELVELVTAYLEGALSAEEHARFEEHLSGCGPCQIYLEQMRTTIRLAGRLTVDAIRPEAEQELLETFRSWKRR
jgi:predicted anti-sigma-YlaC factor YlaD